MHGVPGGVAVGDFGPICGGDVGDGSVRIRFLPFEGVTTGAAFSESGQGDGLADFPFQGVWRGIVFIIRGLIRIKGRQHIDGDVGYAQIRHLAAVLRPLDFKGVVSSEFIVGIADCIAWYFNGIGFRERRQFCVLHRNRAYCGRLGRDPLSDIRYFNCIRQVVMIAFGDGDVKRDLAADVGSGFRAEAGHS